MLNRGAAETFLEKIFPHNPNVILISADFSYPQDPLFRKQCLEKLAKSKTAMVVVVNPESLKNVSVVSERVLLLDEYLCQDHRSEEEDRELGFSLNEEKIANFLENFFRQWEKIESPGSHTIQYERSIHYRWRERWPQALLTGLS